MDKTFQDILNELRKPFAPDLIEWKPQSTSSSQCMVAAFVDPRHYQERLDAACPEWNVHYDFLKDNGSLVLCSITLGDITRQDVGESDAEDKNVATSALAQAFKRTATAFGLGRDLYFLPKQWVDYDPAKKRITGKPTLPDWYIKGEQPPAIAQGDAPPTTSRPVASKPPTSTPPVAATGKGDLVDEIKRRVAMSNDESTDKGWNINRLASEPQAKAVATCLNITLGGDEQRKKFMALVFGVDSATQLTMNQAGVLLGMLTVKDADGNRDDSATKTVRAEFAKRCGAIKEVTPASGDAHTNARSEDDIPW